MRTVKSIYCYIFYTKNIIMQKSNHLRQSNDTEVNKTGKSRE